MNVQYKTMLHWMSTSRRKFLWAHNFWLLLKIIILWVLLNKVIHSGLSRTGEKDSLILIPNFPQASLLAQW